MLDNTIIDLFLVEMAVSQSDLLTTLVIGTICHTLLHHYACHRHAWLDKW